MILVHNNTFLHKYKKVNRGLVFSYDFGNRDSYNHSSPTIVNDLSGNGRHGTILRNGGFSTANGGGLIFNGLKNVTSGTYIQCGPSDGAFTMTGNAYTQQFMYTWTSSEVNSNSNDFLMSGNWERFEAHLLNWNNGGSLDDLGFRIIPAGINEVSIDRTNDSALDDVRYTFLTEDYSKKTTIITIVYDRTDVPNGYCKYFINGRLMYQKNYINKPFDSGDYFANLNGGNFKLKIGARNKTDNTALEGNWFFKGIIHQADFFNVALTDQEVLNNFNCYRNRF